MEEQPQISVGVGNGRSWLSWSTKWSQAATVVIGIAAILISLATLIVVRRQTWIYDEQLKLMAEQRDITRKSERAYVGVAMLDADLKNGKVSVLLQNVGRIPATRINVKLLESRHRPDRKGIGTIAPQQFEGEQIFGTLKMRLSLPLDRFQPGEGDDIMAKREILSVVVTIQYHDGFAMAEKTEFRFQFDGPASTDWTAIPTKLDVR
ncbi:MAG TPA: hypothetical protein VIT88_10655 [Pyrinomonadaceae bacterium]